jgi:hypothetical protein
MKSPVHRPHVPDLPGLIWLRGSATSFTCYSARPREMSLEREELESNILQVVQPCELSRKTRPVADPGTPPSPIFCPEAKSCTVKPPTPGFPTGPMRATGPVAGPGAPASPSLYPPGKSCTVMPRALVIDDNQMSPATRFLWQVMTYVKASNAVVLQMC